MRTWQCAIALALVLGLAYWASRQKNAPPEDDLIAKAVESPDLESALARYVSLESWKAKSSFANNLELANLWESCGHQMMQASTEERLAIAHFASACFKRGARQKEELLSLLHSDDVHLLQGLVVLLSYTVDLGENGEWRLDKPLGGADIPPHLTRIARTHPRLSGEVASTLGIYGAFARGETATLLQMSLSPNSMQSFMARIALLQIDRDLYEQLGLEPPDEPLINKQKKRIENFLARQANQ